MSVFSEKLNGPYKQAALFLTPILIAIGSRYGVTSEKVQLMIDVGCFAAQALMPSLLVVAPSVISAFKGKSE